MSSLILVGMPERGTSWFRHWLCLDSASHGGSFTRSRNACPRSLGGNVSRWVIDQARGHDVRLVHTRNYIPLKTAFHADWLLVQETELAVALVEKFPQFNTLTVVELLKRERDALAETLEERARAGRYDLSLLPADQRRAVADRFREADNKVKELSERIELLETAEGMRSEWREVIERDLASRDIRCQS